jgi:hypothetical protein
MNPHDEIDLLIEETTSAWRPRTGDGTILPHPAWADLDPASRERAFEETVVARRIEAALDKRGRTTTVRAVLGRLGL